MLTKNELEKYNRHLIIPGFDVEKQEKLKKTKILVVGAGGLGSAVLTYLTAAGFGEIGIVDDDIVDASNLQRQILYDVNSIGKSKIEIAHNRLSAINPDVVFNLYNKRLTQDNAQEIATNYDIIIDATDNFSTRYLIDDICKNLDIPWIHGAIQNFEGQLSVFNHNQGACYRDLYPDEKKQAGNDLPIGVIGFLPGIIGSMQVSEAIKLATGIGNVISNKLYIFNALTMNSFTVTIIEE